MERTTLDLWVGVFVTLGFAALVFLALKVGNLTTGSATEMYQVTARFKNIGGLKTRAPVRSAGVLVGRVADVKFDTQNFEAIVTLAIDNRYPFPKDTSAEILTAGLLGEQYIGLEAGGDTANLKNGDKLSLTSSAMVLEKLIGQFMFSKAAEEKKEKAQ